MTAVGHDAAFAEFQARKREAEAAAPARVTWRRVSADTGGGLSGLGPEGRLVFIQRRASGFAFGWIVGTARPVSGSATTLASAKTAAERLFDKPDPAAIALTDRQFAVLEFLCVAVGRGSTLAPILAATGAPESTLATLATLGLAEGRAVGGLEALWHITPLGREIACGHIEESEHPAPRPVTPNTKESNMSTTVTPDPKTRPVASAAKKPAAKKPVSDEMKTLYATAVAQVKDAVKSAKTVEKQKYVRVNTKAGKTVAYVDHPTSKGVAIAVPKKTGGGYDDFRAVKTSELAAAMKAVAARVALLDAKTAAEAAA